MAVTSLTVAGLWLLLMAVLAGVAAALAVRARRQVKQMEMEGEGLKAELTLSEARLVDLDQRAARSREEAHKAQEEVRKAQARIADQAAAVSRTGSEIDGLRDRLTRMTAEEGEWKAHAAAAEAETLALRQRVMALEEEAQKALEEAEEERRRAKEHSEQANRAHREREIFFAILAHELKSPVTGIAKQAEGLRFRQERGKVAEAGRGSVEDALARILDECQRFDTLFTNWQRVIDVVFRRRDVGHQPVDLRALCQDLAREFHEGGRNILIAVPEGEPVMARGDRALLRHAVQNLYSNAVKYGIHSAGQQVETLFGRSSEGRVLLRVRDPGPGIPYEERNVIFAPFYRSRNLRDVQQGAGLGLYLAHQIVDRHGGALRFQNNSQIPGRPHSGQGVTFTLELDPA